MKIAIDSFGALMPDPDGKTLSPTQRLAFLIEEIETQDDACSTRPPVAPRGLLQVRTSACVRSSSLRAAGGDFAESFLRSDSSLAIAVGDCSGHGAEATVGAALFRAAIRSLLGGDGDLVSIAARLNRLLYRQAASGSMPWPFVTVFLAVVDPTTRMLTYLSCGHDAALLFGEDASHTHLLANAPVLGVSDVDKFTVDAVAVDRLGALVVATNGLSDARPLDADVFFGTGGICAAFLSMRREIGAGARNAVDGASRLIESARRHSDGRLDDDAAAFIAYFE